MGHLGKICSVTTVVTDNPTAPDQPDELSAEGVANKAVDQEIDPGVDDRCEVGNVSQTLDEHDRSEEFALVFALKNSIDM